MLDRSTFTGPWAGLPTAWNETDRFDEATYRRDVRACCQAGAPGVYTHGSTGEFYAMEFDEWKAVATACAEECRAAGTPCMIGCTSTYTLGVVRRVEVARQLNAEAVQIALPYWYEMRDEQIVPFFKDVMAAGEGLALSIYETTRAKKVLSLDQHRAVHDAVPAYLMVKSNAGTVGSSEAGCAALSDFVNVFVGETDWGRLGPHGAIGSPSSLFYANPRYILKMWEHLKSRQFEPLNQMCDKLIAYHEKGMASLLPGHYHDSSYDRLDGLLAGFLQTSTRNRGPYPSTNQTDIQNMRDWCLREFPEFLEL